MNVHFVCAGNSYRSRLAEAVVNARGVSGLRATSSGTHASTNENGPISWYAARLLKNHALIPFMSPSWTQTAAELLAKSDLTIFMARSCYRYCRVHYGYTSTAYRLWDVPDLDGFTFAAPRDSAEGELERIAATEATFILIERKVDELLAGYGTATFLTTPAGQAGTDGRSSTRSPDRRAAVDVEHLTGDEA